MTLWKEKRPTPSRISSQAASDSSGLPLFTRKRSAAVAAEGASLAVQVRCSARKARAIGTGYKSGRLAPSSGRFSSWELAAA